MSPVLATLAGASVRGYGLLGASGGAAGFESIATTTAAGGETTLTFSSIPGTYASLQLRGIGRTTQATTGAYIAYMRFNSDTGTNYADHRLYGNGTSAVAAGNTSVSSPWTIECLTGDSNTAGIFGAFVIDIHDYASTSRYKTIRAFDGWDANGSGKISLNSSLWMSTAAVTSIQIITNSTAFKAGTTFALYGIKGAA